MKIALFTFIFLTLTSSGYSLETDQFLTANLTLRDSVDVMNNYFQISIQNALDKANKKDLLCNDVALKVIETATGKWSISKASSFASSSPLIDRFPKDSVSERGYIKLSFYQHAWLPLQVVDLARTININGIYLGTDKFGHFTRMGMNYYKTYLKLITQNMSEDEAIKKAIIKGYGSEYGILGYGIGGVLSYGDLEANFQGLIFSLDMCHGDEPILVKESGKWIENPKHIFDLKNYFNPKMDESYNLSFWRKRLYNKINNKLQSEYCNAQKSEIFKRRINEYSERVKRNLNDELIEENILSQPRFDRALEDLSPNCSK